MHICIMFNIKYNCIMTYKEFLEEKIKECKNKADFCRALDKNPTGGNYRIIDDIIKKYNLDASHFTQSPWNKGHSYRQHQYTLDEILTENSPHKNTYSLKKRLIKYGILEPKCAICGTNDRLELHHINGNPSDNRLENLQILCINHHYDTHNFRNKKGNGRIHFLPEKYFLNDEEIRIRNEARRLAKRRGIKISQAIDIINNTPNKSINDIPRKISRRSKNKICPICNKEFHRKNYKQKYCSYECFRKATYRNITKEDLLNNIIKFNGNFTQIGKFYGITDNAIRKWCKKYELPIHSKELRKYIEQLNSEI